MKVLVIGPSWVGDMVMSHSLYRCLKANYPKAQIEVLAPAWCKPLLTRMPEVAIIHEMPIGHRVLDLRVRRTLGFGMKAAQFTHAIVLPNSFKSALIPYFAQIPYRRGWRGEWRYGLLNDLRLLDKDAFPLMVQRYAALAFPKEKIRIAQNLPDPLPAPVLEVSQAEIATARENFSLGDEEWIGFCPGAEFGPAKRWPHYHFATLAAYLIESGKRIVLFGSKNDYEIAELIKNSLNVHQREYCRNLAGQTSLDQVVTLIGACRAIVTNDSGLMHVAAALDVPLIAIYGPSSPDFTPPLAKRAKIIRLITGYHRIRNGEAGLGYHQSLIDISPEIVGADLQDLLS